ncbi:MAG: HlyD family type I secretion periplasmic adaptor subunit [Litorimonas sp.]
MNAPLPEDFRDKAQSLAVTPDESAAATSYQRYLRIGYIGVACLVFGLVGWASIAKIKGAVIAPGFVAVEGKPATIQHFDGGIVGEIYVRDGAKVEAGDPLIRLDPTEIDASREIVEVQLNETRARVERLRTERDGLDRIVFPDDLLASAAGNPRVSNAVNGQRSLFEARKAALEGQVGQLRQQLGQLDSQIAGLESLIRSNRQQIDKLEQERVAKQKIVDQGFLANTAVFAIEREQLRLDGDLKSRQSEIERLRGQIVETRGQIAQLQRDRHAEVLSELRLAETEASGFRERLTAAAAQAGRIVIAAPVSGTVHNLLMTTTGGVVQPAAEIMQIIPSDAQLIILTQVQPADIDQVYTGQPATVRLSAFNARTTPELNGSVVRIAPDRLVDPATGFPYYDVQVELPASELDLLPDTLELKPGMPAEAFMQTESRTVLIYLLQPAIDAMRRAGREQ